MADPPELPAELELSEDGTLVIRLVRGTKLDGEGAARVMKAHIALAQGRAWPTLVDLRDVRSVDLASRQLASSSEVIAIVARMALLVNSPATRVIGTFFLKVQSPKFPTRIFDDEVQARAWLQGDKA